jgi:hypothetical protein
MKFFQFVVNSHCLSAATNIAASSASMFNSSCPCWLATPSQLMATTPSHSLLNKLSSSFSPCSLGVDSVGNSFQQFLSCMYICCHRNQLSHVVYWPLHSSGWLLLFNYTVIMSQYHIDHPLYIHSCTRTLCINMCLHVLRSYVV